MRYYSIHRRRTLNDAQVVQFADVLNDVAQVIFAAFFIPLFFGEASIFSAISGACMAVLLWYVSISIVR